VSAHVVLLIDEFYAATYHGNVGRA
jgi:hypothetical protein